MRIKVYEWLVLSEETRYRFLGAIAKSQTLTRSGVRKA